MSLLNLLPKDCTEKTAIVFNDKHFSYSQLKKDALLLIKWFSENSIQSACINLSNSYEWVVIDIACQEAGVICTPIPQFFSANQVKHLVEQTQPDIVFGKGVGTDSCSTRVTNLNVDVHFYVKTSATVVPNTTSKITFTSGSTGSPKGVCLSLNNQLTVARSLVDAIGIEKPRHLALLPLATLLENIAGIYSPLLANGEVIIPSEGEKGFSGSRLTNMSALLECISTHSPNTIILVPELLQILIFASQNGWKAPTSLKFIAVGGAKVDASLIKTARKYHLPVFQGYGLSECASVVSICTEIDEPLDSVGKVLAHAKVETINGELVVHGNVFLGYLGNADTWYPTSVYTGDIAELDKGKLFINGRSKNLIINSFGRNISPEWLESKLMSTGMFAQNMVVGNEKPYLCALLVPLCESMTHEQIQSALLAVNQDLPDYAKILDFILLPDPFSVANGLLTENGKLKRAAIELYYLDRINQQYSQQSSIAV